MSILLLFALLPVQFIKAQKAPKFIDGIRKSSGSYECPTGYNSIQDIDTCKQIASGKCLSDRADECKLWAAYVNHNGFANDQGTDNQPGCYYDQGHGVLFNTNNKWSGRINENNDRPICELSAFTPISGLYHDGVRKPGGSHSCPSGYVPLQDQEECKNVAEGRCLSSRADECKLWSKWANSDTFAKDQGQDNQPGCYYDQDHGVLFNTNTAWSGNLNEGNDRPICKFRSAKFGYVTNGTCEDVGMHSIFSDQQCKAAAAGLSSTNAYGIPSKWTYIYRAGNHGSGRPTGCSFHRAGNVELWETSSGKCNVNGYAGCFCLKDDLYADGIRKSSGSNSCPTYYVPISDAEECKKVAEGPCLSSRADECKLWSKWVNSDTFAKDQGRDNQPGCYYDQGHGVLFNTNNNWSGRFNENNDRPVCIKDSETFSESKIVRMLRQLILDAQKEINSITNDVLEAEKVVSAAKDDLADARVVEGQAKADLVEAKRVESAALGRLEASKKELSDTAPDLKDEMQIFKTILTKLDNLSNGKELVEKNEVNLDAASTALISSMQQADPVQVKKVSDMINTLLQDAATQLRILEQAVLSASEDHKKATEASARAYGIWNAADKKVQSALAKVSESEGILSKTRQHAAVRIPTLRGEIDDLEEAIVLIKSLEE